MFKRFINGNGQDAAADHGVEEKSIHFGQDAQTGEPVDLSLEDLTGTHTQIVGASGSGKSYGILKLEEKLLTDRISYPRIEPEGQHHDLVFDFLAEHPELADNLIEFNLSEPMGHWFPGLALPKLVPVYVLGSHGAPHLHAVPQLQEAREPCNLREPELPSFGTRLTSQRPQGVRPPAPLVRRSLCSNAL